MKLLTIVALLLLAQNLYAQTEKKHNVNYKAVITSLNPNASVSGNLTSISDSSIFISSTKYSSKSAAQVTQINYNDINKVSLRRRGSTGKGIMIGSIIGLATGIVVGLASYEKPQDDVGQFVDDLFHINKTTMAFTGGVLGVLSGGTAGAIVGSLIKKRFVIGGNKEKFQAMRSKILF